MAVGGDRCHAAARRALQITLLYQIGLEHVFNRIAFFTDRRGEIIDADRAAGEFFDHCEQQFAVHDIEPQRIDVEHFQRRIGDFLRDLALRLDLGVIAHAPQEPVRDTRGRARTARDFARAVGVNFDLQQFGRARDDAREFGDRIKLQPRHDAEAVAQRIGQHARTRGRADQGKGRQVELDRARRRALADHDIDLEVFERRIEYFFDHRRQAMYLVDEQHVVRLEIGEHRREIARALQHGAGGVAQVHAHFTRDDMRERCFAQPRRAEQQHVIERLLALARGLDEDFKLAADFFLADIFVELLRPQRALERFLPRGGGRGGYQSVSFNHISFSHSFDRLRALAQ